MKRFNLFLALTFVILFALLGLSKMQAQPIGWQVVNSYGITDKSPEFQLEVLLDIPVGIVFNSLKFSVTHQEGLYLYGASTVDDSYQWTFIDSDSTRYHNDVKNIWEVRKGFTFMSMARKVGKDSAFALRLHFFVNQPSAIPAGDTLSIWLSNMKAYVNDGSEVAITPGDQEVRIPFGEKADTIPPTPQDSVGFRLTSIVPVYASTTSKEAVVRLNVVSNDLPMNQMQFIVEAPWSFNYNYSVFGQELDGYAYNGFVDTADITTNRWFGVIWTPSAASFFRNSQYAYTDIHFVIKPNVYHAGDTAWFTLMAMHAYQVRANSDTTIEYPIKGMDPNLSNLAVRFPVIFIAEETPPDTTNVPKSDSVAYTIKQINQITPDSPELVLGVDMQNYNNVAMNRFEFMIRMDPNFEPKSMDVVSGDIVNYSMTPSGFQNGKRVWEFEAHKSPDSLRMDSHLGIEIHFGLAKNNNFVPNDTVHFIIFNVYANLQADTLIRYPIKGNQRNLYYLAYDLPVIFGGQVEPPKTGPLDFWFDAWTDELPYFLYGANQMAVVLKRQDTSNTITNVSFDVNISSKYADLDVFSLDYFDLAPGNIITEGNPGDTVLHTGLDHQGFTNGNYYAKGIVEAFGIKPNKSDHNPADFLMFNIVYRGIYSEEMTFNLTNIKVNNNAPVINRKQDKIMSIIAVDQTESTTINFVEPLRRILQATNIHDVDGDGDFDLDDAMMAREMVDGKFFGNLKSRIAADAVWPINFQIDMNDYLELRRLLTTGVDELTYGDGINLNNYPNPVSGNTTINFNLPSNGNITLVLYDLLGNKVQTLASGYFVAGPQQVTVDCSDLLTGSYTYSLQAGTVTRVARLAVK
jgi:hypothetical protein